ncbi:uncharacterized protein [Lolium perenne]|uniref:uncharacterized protein n=1 Tax=Lolium perenne TaxID=4522 RepID=UPI0021F5C948|nr:uncharacterized protein LOC127339100 [Lolium perenne]
MSESEGAEPTRRRRRGSSPAAQASLPDDDDMLREILLRLPPQPSSLPRASAVCKRWRGLVTDPRFHRQFYAHHGKPPLLGVFKQHLGDDNPFRPMLDPPDRIPERFGLRRQIGTRAHLLGCRHGRVLLMDFPRHKIIVCDPITRKHNHIDLPLLFRGSYMIIYGDVLCAAVNQGHVHGSCHSSPFKVVLMFLSRGQDDTTATACVYSSETGAWGDIISTTDPCELFKTNPGILVGNVLYWSSKSVNVFEIYLGLDHFTDDIIEFDLDRQSLAVIKGPPCLNASLRHQIIQADNGSLGLAMFSHGRLEMWHREVNCHGGVAWLLHKTVEMHTVLRLPPQVEGWMRNMVILGYDEGNVAVFVHLDTSVYMVQLISMQSRKLHECMDIAGSRHTGRVD